VLISEGLWRRRFAADPGLVGRTIELDGAPTPVLGVLPDTVGFPGPAAVWAPKRLRPGEREDRLADYRHAIGRLAPGVTPEQAQRDLDRVAALSAGRHPQIHAGRGLAAVPLAEVVLGPVRPAIHLLLAAAGLLLAIACANVAGLLFARGSERQSELAVRGALGAGRGRLGRQLLTESVLLAALGGIVGLGLAALATPLLVRLLPPDLPRATEIALDGRVLAVGVVLILATGLAAGLAPALRLTRPHLAAALHAGGRASEDPQRARVRQGLVVAEIALALVLLVTAGLLMRSFTRLVGNELGFVTEGRLALQVFLWDRNPTEAARAARVDEISARLAALPGVEAVGVVSALPFHPGSIDIETEVRAEGRPERPGEGADTAFATVASPGYFRAVGIPLVSGRGFGDADRDGAPPVALVNRTLARRMFGGADPHGERLIVGQDGRMGTWEIVGVVGDVRSKGFDSEPRPEVYVPFAQSRTGSLTFVVAAAGDAVPLLPLAQQVVWDVDPEQTIYDAAILDDYVADTVAERRFLLLLVAGFSAVALLLAAVGTFALISYSVAQRSHEMAIRRALGAPPRALVVGVLVQAVRLGVPGVALGLLLAAAAAGALRPLLYRVAPSDPLTLVPLAVLMLGVTLLGAWLPARHAAATDPAAALRQV
jgi:predicted permease